MNLYILNCLFVVQTAATAIAASYTAVEVSSLDAVINDEYDVEVAVLVMEAKDDVEAVGDISFKRVSELIDIIGDYVEKGIEVVK